MVFLHVGGQVIVLGLHIGEPVNAADNHGSVLAQAVQDDTQWLGAHLVGVQGNLDGALRGGEGLMAGQESEALRLLVQQHGAEIAVADADLALVRHGAGNAESLQTDTDPLCGFGSSLRVFFHGNGGAELIGPLHVLKAYGLRALDDRICINAHAVGESLDIFKGFEAVFVQDGLQLRHASFVVFKQSHLQCLLLFFTWVDPLDRPVFSFEPSIGT